MKTNPKLFGLYFWLHLPLALLANFSFLILSWRLIIFGITVLFIQFVLLKGCILTIAENGTHKDMTFYTPYLEKMGFKFNRRKFMIYMKWFHPFVILLMALVIQIGFKYQPLLSIFS